MGVVYKARRCNLRRVVALKMLLAGGEADANLMARFRTEEEVMERLRHPNVVQIQEAGEHNGLPYFSLEYCPGGSLHEKLRGGPLPPAEAAALVEQLAAAMQAAHARGVVHRDLKPANVLLAEDGTPKVSDFGLAKKLNDPSGQTACGVILGTPSYMAPEQARGEPREVGPAADTYALGAILYECLTGRPPFQAATATETLEQVLDDEPVPPTRLNGRVPRVLETICLKCLHKDPRRRYASAGELAEDLRCFRAGQTVRTRPVVRRVRRSPTVARLLAAVALVLLAGTALSAYCAFPSARQADQACVDETWATWGGGQVNTNAGVSAKAKAKWMQPKKPSEGAACPCSRRSGSRGAIKTWAGRNGAWRRPQEGRWPRSNSRSRPRSRCPRPWGYGRAGGPRWAGSALPSLSHPPAC
jgi:serine/threonine-protein kinase